jgi:hypothetical protein
LADEAEVVMKALSGRRQKKVDLPVVLLLAACLLVAVASGIWATLSLRSLVTADKEVQTTLAVPATGNAELATQVMVLAAVDTTPSVGLAASEAAPSDSPKDAGELALGGNAGSPTSSPSQTPHPAAMDTESPTATATLVPTKRPTETPKPASPPSEPLQIHSFSADPDPVERGGKLTLAWHVSGAASVGITRLSEEGNIFLAAEALDLPASGSLTLQVPEDYVSSVSYYLGARDADGALERAYVTVGIRCRYEAYIAIRCPLTQDHAWAAYQPFERGHMVWREDTREIYVLYDDGLYETYEDTWQEGDAVTIEDTPPPGRLTPIRGFGNLWAPQPAVREGLGWATAAEGGYTMQVETTHGGSGRYPGTNTYLTLPDGRVVFLYCFTPTWEIVE